MPDKLTEDQVRHVARLSRLHLNDDEVRQFTTQLSEVIDYVSKLSELDVQDVEPMAHALDITNVLAEDQPIPGLSVDRVLACAPQRSPPFFKVPKVLRDVSGA